jgi:hypothetical protein
VLKTTTKLLTAAALLATSYAIVPDVAASPMSPGARARYGVPKDAKFLSSGRIVAGKIYPHAWHDRTTHVLPQRKQDRKTGKQRFHVHTVFR